MRSIVAAFVDETTGQLWRADVITRDPRDERFAFDYVALGRRSRHDKTFDLLVPTTMHEDFFAGIEPATARETRKYTNYRRFQTSAQNCPPAAMKIILAIAAFVSFANLASRQRRRDPRSSRSHTWLPTSRS